MFIVNEKQEFPSSRGATYAHFAPNGAGKIVADVAINMPLLWS